MTETLKAAREEVQKTVDDLQETIPGLQISCLLTVPCPPHGVDANFFSSHDPVAAISLMKEILNQSQEHEASKADPSTPEAS